MFSYLVQKSSTFGHVTPSKKVINQVKVLGFKLKLDIHTSMHPYIKDLKVEVCRGVNWHSIQEGCRWGGRGGEGVNWQSTWKGSVKILQGLPLTRLILGDWLTVNLETSANTLQGLSLAMLIQGVDQWSTWEGSTKTLQGLPLTMLILMLILWDWSMVNLGRIHEDFARITSDNVDPGGLIDSQLGKDLWRLCKDYLWQCWSLGQSRVNLGRICKDFARITSDNVDPGGQSMVNLERIHKNFARITSDNVDPGGSININLERIHEDFARITSDNVDPGRGWLMVNLERICEDFARITSHNVDPGGSIYNQLGKDPWRLCKDYLWQCWSWGGVHSI